MGVWGSIAITAVGIAAFILILSLLSNYLISIAAGKFSQKTLNTSIQEIEDMLPGKNCGACGCETCAEYARAVFALQKDPDLCTVGDPDLTEKLQTYMIKFQKNLENDTPEEENIWRHK